MAIRATMPDADSVRALLDGDGRLLVRVTPGARQTSVTVDEAGLAIKVTAAPEDGKANTAVIAIVAKVLGIAKSRVTLARGGKSRQKCLLIS